MTTPPHPPARPVELPPGAPGPGELVAGKYVVERVLGMGGMGLVLAARHVDLDERVAIKMLLPHVPPQGEPAARFIREARAAIKIRSEHVVRVLDVGRLETGAPYIVMEYLDGCDLGQLVERSGPLPIDDAIEYVTQACEAIAAAHSLGIVHRDLKPGNLFLTYGADGRPCVKVLDFGISKISEGVGGPAPELTTTATIMGTPAFMSPEQLRSTRDVDARADIWSMGAIVYALLTGAPPYDGESNADVSAKIIRDPPPPLRSRRADASPELEAAVMRCLEKEPDRRFADVSELARALAAAANRESVRAAAERVARVAAGIAPTLVSGHEAGATSPAQAATPPAGDTRTASAWGESTGREERSRRRTGLVAGLLLAGAVAGVGLVAMRSRSGGGRGGSAVGTAAAGAGPTAPVSMVASASGPASAPGPAPGPASASVSARARAFAPPPARHAAPLSSPAPASRGAPSASPASRPAAPQPSASAAKPAPAGLFDRRE